MVFHDPAIDDMFGNQYRNKIRRHLAIADARLTGLHDVDQDFLLAGDVFTADLIETWIELKREEIDALRQRPHPYEFDLYYGI